MDSKSVLTHYSHCWQAAMLMADSYSWRPRSCAAFANTHIHIHTLISYGDFTLLKWCLHRSHDFFYFCCCCSLSFCECVLCSKMYTQKKSLKYILFTKVVCQSHARRIYCRRRHIVGGPYQQFCVFIVKTMKKETTTPVGTCSSSFISDFAFTWLRAVGRDDNKNKKVALAHTHNKLQKLQQYFLAICSFATKPKTMPKRNVIRRTQFRQPHNCWFPLLLLRLTSLLILFTVSVFITRFGFVLVLGGEIRSFCYCFVVLCL